MTILPCSAPDCHRPVYVKKWALCQSHYNRFMSNRDLRIEAPVIECQRCGEAVTRKSKKPGPAPKYCTDRCRQLTSYARRVESGAQAVSYAKVREAFQAKPITARLCLECRGSFLAKRDDAKFCSTTCNNQWRDKHNESRCSEADCGRGIRAKGLCSMHWRRKARAEGRESNDPWNDRRKAHWHKRRAQKLNLPADIIRPADVYERDEWVCSLCALPVDRNAAYPDPMSASLDHVQPLSLGGHHTMENVTLAHLSCNIRKGNRVEADAMSA